MSEDLVNFFRIFFKRECFSSIQLKFCSVLDKSNNTLLLFGKLGNSIFSYGCRIGRTNYFLTKQYLTFASSESLFSITQIN